MFGDMKDSLKISSWIFSWRNIPTLFRKRSKDEDTIHGDNPKII